MCISLKASVQFEEGDLVSLYTPHTKVGLSKKFLSQKKGPYKVVQKHSPVSYTIAPVSRPEKLKRVHARRLTRWHEGKIPELDNVKEGETPTDRDQEDEDGHGGQTHEDEDGRGSPIQEDSDEESSSTESLAESTASDEEIEENIG